ncbi:MAG: hypothetical protein DCF31_15970 [Alphaproteobacteria bacterium]|nr:MAG: hypothetical protein DCF31_15970 [Alphaproteobacteria bacterium]
MRRVDRRAGSDFRNTFISVVSSGIQPRTGRGGTDVPPIEYWSFLPLAVTPREPDEAFLREVDEGVRRDQVASLWQRFGKLGIALVIVLLGALAFYLWRRDNQAAAAGVAGEQLSQAMTQLEVGEGAKARPVIDRLAEDGPAGYGTVAKLVQASDAIGGGDSAKAVKMLDAIAADTGQPQPVRDAALLKSVRLSYDTLPPATVIARLKPLAVPGNAWFGLAGEMTALAQLKAGQNAAARPLLIAITRDETLPPSLRSRTAQLAVAEGVDPAQLQSPAVLSGTAK